MKGQIIYFSQIVKLNIYIHRTPISKILILQIQINPGSQPKSLETDALRTIDTSNPCYSLRHDVRILEWNDFVNSEISPFVLGLLANSQQNPTRYIDVTLKQ